MLETERANDYAHDMARCGNRSSIETNWAYLVASDGTPWPKDTIPVRDYLRGLAAESCSRTGPRSVLQVLAFVAVKSAPVGKRVSVYSVLLKYVADFEAGLAPGPHLQGRPNDSSSTRR